MRCKRCSDLRIVIPACCQWHQARLVMGVSPAMSHTLVITAPARENLFLTDPQSVSGPPGGAGENINKVKSVDI